MLHTNKEGGPSLSSFSRSVEVHGLQPEWDLGKKNTHPAAMIIMKSSTQGSQGRDAGFSMDNLLVFVNTHTSSLLCMLRACANPPM